MSSPHYILINMNYHELSTNYRELRVAYSYLVTNSFYSPLPGTCDVAGNIYVGFTPYANILHSYRALCLNVDVVLVGWLSRLLHKPV